MLEQTNIEYDVIIIGGGMVGASLAHVLDSSSKTIPLKVLLIESLPIRAQLNAAQPSFDSRSTVLSYGTVEYLSVLGLWDKLEPFAEAINKIQVSDQGKFGTVRIDSDTQEVPALGYVVENQKIGQVLNNTLLSANSIDVESPAQVTAVQPEKECISVTVLKDNNETVIRTKLVVLAEGGRSGLCDKLGIYRSHEKYQQTAIIANVAFSKSHNNIAYERFTKKGPLALLPLQDLENEHRAALIWTHASEEVDKIMSLGDEDFLRLLQEDFGMRLGEFSKVGHRASYSLSLEKAEEQIRHGIVLLGNVAHTLHPVAGQGFNLAFRDTMRLSQVITQALSRGENPGRMKNLQKYLNLAEFDQDKTIAFSHYMTQLFSTDNITLSWARKAGLLSIDYIAPLKNNFASQAMGRSDVIKVQ